MGYKHADLLNYAKNSNLVIAKGENVKNAKKFSDLTPTKQKIVRESYKKFISKKKKSAPKPAPKPEPSNKDTLPLTSLTPYDPERRKRQGDETYYLKLRNKALTSSDFAKWFRTGETLTKDYRVEINGLFQKIKDQGVKLYFAQNFRRSNFAIKRNENYVDLPDHRRDLDLKIVAIKNGKLIVPKGVRKMSIPSPLDQRDFEEAQGARGTAGRYFDIKFFKNDDMGYKISSEIV